MIVLIVGPSGCGKSTAIELVQPMLPQFILRRLDKLAAQLGVVNGIIHRESVTLLRETLRDDELFLAFGLEAVGVLAGEHPGKSLVVDVGAGFQVARSAKYLNRIHQVIAITATPEVAYQRIKQGPNRNERRTVEHYRKVEFSPHRFEVYRSAQHSIDTTQQTPEETAEALKQLLLSIH